MTGQELRAWRESARLTQIELGKRLGVHAQQVYKWESGKAGIVHPDIMRRALRDVARELAEELAALQDARDR
ncbi:MAG: helix-turn-helix transcriptional regulator [Thermomicrobiales bacterium]|nr:helix-turn-helix transcriptional regulator [Thermomicrobiales bacterium]